MSTAPHTETWSFRYENANGRGMSIIIVPFRSTTQYVMAEIVSHYPGNSISRLSWLGEDEK
jgi:hypothetical protein